MSPYSSRTGSFRYWAVASEEKTPRSTHPSVLRVRRLVGLFMIPLSRLSCCATRVPACRSRIARIFGRRRLEQRLLGGKDVTPPLQPLSTAGDVRCLSSGRDRGQIRRGEPARSKSGGRAAPRAVTGFRR